MQLKELKSKIIRDADEILVLKADTKYYDVSINRTTLCCGDSNSDS